MIARIQTYIQEHNLFNSGTPILLTCSGGVDSMVLCDVLLKLNYKIGIAHCNFQLRENESAEDEKFVEHYAAQNKLPFHSVKFDTKAFKKGKTISTQMAARELRYEWFEKIRKENNYHKIVSAHHLDDQVETILLNMTKGTGLQGLTGMQAQNGFVVRPMLEISKQEILQYAKENKVDYREDSSNETDNYQRNKIRHHVIPILNEINPVFSNSAIDFITRMNEYALLTNEYINKLKQKCCAEKNGIIGIKLGFIKSHKAGQTILFHLLNEYGFNNDIVNNILYVKESGKQFFSDTHRIIIDRKSLFVVPKIIERENYLLFEKIPNQIIFNKYKIQCTLVPIQEVKIKTSNRYAYFDADKLEFPLIIRYSKEGDYFYPFGLGKQKIPEKAGKKKLSKYFKDEKFSLLDKENTAVLFSGEKLIWLVSHRIDDRFKVTEKTKNVLKMVVVDENA